jgi:hypothetical protein
MLTSMEVPMKRIAAISALVACAVIAALWLRTSRGGSSGELRSGSPEEARLDGAGEARKGGTSTDFAPPSGAPSADALRGGGTPASGSTDGEGARALPELPSATRYPVALRWIAATDEEASHIERIERARSDAFRAKDAMSFDSHDDELAGAFAIIQEEREALVALLGEERAAAYLQARANEVEVEVLQLIGPADPPKLD